MEITNTTSEAKADFPGQVIELPGGGMVTGGFQDLINWARSNS